MVHDACTYTSERGRLGSQAEPDPRRRGRARMLFPLRSMPTANTEGWDRSECSIGKIWTRRVFRYPQIGRTSRILPSVCSEVSAKKRSALWPMLYDRWQTLWLMTGPRVRNIVLTSTMNVCTDVDRSPCDDWSSDGFRLDRLVST